MHNKIWTVYVATRTSEEITRKMYWQTLGVVLLISVLSVKAGYQNNFDQPLNVDCHAKSGLYGLNSRYSPPHRDRQFEFLCKAIATIDLKHCKWTAHVNQWDGPLLFQCPSDYVMAGVKSIHDNSKEDRLWQFKCCKAPCYVTKSCALSPFINSYKSMINYKAPAKKVFVGAFSFHDNSQEDRMWKMLACDYEKKANCDC